MSFLQSDISSFSSSSANSNIQEKERKSYVTCDVSTQECENSTNFELYNTSESLHQNNSLDYILAEFPPPKTPYVLEDTVIVPCIPIEPIFGLAFLSSAAYAELKCNSRKNVLLVDDEIDLPLWYAKQLYFKGKVRLHFPDIYKKAQCLSNDGCLSLQVGLLSPFFFEVGLFLCDVVNPDEWPIPNLRKILAYAELQRWNYILRFDKNIQKKTNFFNGMTWRECALYNEIIRVYALNKHSGSTRGALGGFGDFAIKDV